MPVHKLLHDYVERAARTAFRKRLDDAEKTKFHGTLSVIIDPVKVEVPRDNSIPIPIYSRNGTHKKP